MEQQYKIIQVAWGLFREKGIKATTIEAICKELKISKKTFYKYFKNKEDLIAFSFDINKNRISQLIQDSYKTNQSPFIVLVKILKFFRKMVHAKTYDSNNDLFFPISSIIIEEISTVYPDLWEKIDRFRHEIIMNLSALLENEKEDYLRNEINTKIVTTMLLSVLENIIHPDFLRKNKIPVNEAVDSVIALLFTGMIKTEKQDEIKKLIYENNERGRPEA